MNPLSSVKCLSGVGESSAKALARLGIETVRDLLFHIPSSYEHRGNVRLLSEGTDGTPSSFMVTVGTAPKTVKVKGTMVIPTLWVS
ncbi:MAG: hypothetical protein MJ078_06820, partial [Clostridia bacterium]|nr:hypothetical protein [Clostridia bacterium]